MHAIVLQSWRSNLSQAHAKQALYNWAIFSVPKPSYNLPLKRHSQCIKISFQIYLNWQVPPLEQEQ